jgi:hypothetical protein
MELNYSLLFYPEETSSIGKRTNISIVTPNIFSFEAFVLITN